jgi:hypothetical protein
MGGILATMTTLVSLVGGVAALLLPIVAPLATIAGTVWMIYDNWNRVVKAFKSGAQSFVNIGKDCIRGLWEGIKTGWDWMEDKLESLVKTITKPFKKILGIFSPSRVFSDEIGKMLPLGIAEGFKAAMPAAHQIMQASLDRGINLLVPDRVAIPVSQTANGNLPATGQTGGNTYNFYSPVAIDPVQARREVEQLNRKIAWGV